MKLICGNCVHYDPEADIHPWYLEGCVLKDTRSSPNHRYNSIACEDFQPKEAAL